MTTTGSLNRTGAGNLHHWLARDPTGSTEQDWYRPKILHWGDRGLSGHNVRHAIITGTGRPGGLTAATSITGSGRSIFSNQFPVALVVFCLLTLDLPQHQGNI